MIPRQPFPCPSDTRQPDDPGVEAIGQLSADFVSFCASEQRRAAHLAMMSFAAGLCAGAALSFAMFALGVW